MRRFIIAILTGLLFLTACDVNKRDPRTPAPSVKQVETSFFFEFNADRTKYKSRRFIFGVSPEDKVGAYRDVHMDHLNTFGSANLEFDFNDEGTMLIGRLVNPSYPNEKDKWQILVTFRVSRSYYEENRVDGTGRTSDDKIQRSDKSDPRARPFMDIELSSMRFHNRVMIGPFAALRDKIIQRVYDVEWSQDGKFLGFTTVATNPLLGSYAQTIDRVNLLRIQPGNPKFEETFYHEKNSNHIALVDIISSRPNHFGQRLKAAHWDINAKTKRKYKIHLNNFPKEYVQVAIDSVESWNDAFEREDVVGYRPFEYEVVNRKYAFDIRYHTIHWEDDIRLSAAGPLGLANSIVDITTGEVLWSASIVWGGLIDQHAAASVPSFAAVDMSTAKAETHSMNSIMPVDSSFMARPFASLEWNRPSVGSHNMESFDEFLDYITDSYDAAYDKEVTQNFDNLVAQKLRDLDAQVLAGTLDQATANAQLARFKEDIRPSDQLVTSNEMRSFARRLRKLQPVNYVDLEVGYEALEATPFNFEHMQADLGLKPATYGENSVFFSQFNSRSAVFQDVKFKNPIPKVIEDSVVEMPDGYMDFLHDVDDKAIDNLYHMNLGIRQMMAQGKIVDINEVKRGMIRKTIVHEIGHTLGLGHNFKANIMPEVGSVPKHIHETLQKDADNGMINRSTIMGYPHPQTIIRTPYAEQKPGFNDITRLRYLYKQEYPIYDKSQNGAGEYEWVKLKVDGKIRDKVYSKKAGKWLTPGYLPNCGTMEAILYHDPYCNRHDRGYDAQTLMTSYFDFYWDGIFRMLESNIDALTTDNYKAVEAGLWNYTATTLSRGRLFHDYMRNKYRDEIAKLKVPSDPFTTYENVLNFSTSCNDLVGKSSDELQELLDDEKYAKFIEKRSDGQYKVNEFGDLCIATKTYYSNIEKLLQIEGKDYTEIDYFDRFMPDGITEGDGQQNPNQTFGRWKRIGLLPIKVKIMQNILLPLATMNIPRVGEQLIYTYYRPDTAFSMATLYPKEYLTVLKSLVKNGVSLTEDEEGKIEPRLSRSLQYLGYFLRFQGGTNDYGLFPDLLDAVENQTKFRFSNAIINITANREDSGEVAKTFTGLIRNNFNNIGDEDLGNIYLYTLKRIIMKSHTNSLILQMSPIRWNRPNSGGAYAIKADYEPSTDFKELDNFSPRQYFIKTYKDAIEVCVNGDNRASDNGLSSYFKKIKEFDGVTLPATIYQGSQGDYEILNESIKTQLQKFAEARDFDLSNCERALKTQKALVLGSALLGGIWIPDTMKALRAGVN